MAGNGQTLLRALLRSRHLQEHRAFCRTYERVARELDGAGRASQPPSKATFYRWMSGGVARIPHPNHCRVLEAMFPGCTVPALFAAWDAARPLPVDSEPCTDKNLGLPRRAAFADLTAAFGTRAEFSENMAPRSLFDQASTIQAAGLSLNLLCQQYGDQSLRAALMRGTRVQALFLDPDGRAMAARESEEGHDVGDLAGLTRLNMQMLRRICAELPEPDRDRIEVRTYDATIRFNITIIDDCQCIAQPYLPAVRGIDSPTFVIRRRGEGVGMFATFERIYQALWGGARVCD